MEKSYSIKYKAIWIDDLSKRELILYRIKRWFSNLKNWKFINLSKYQIIPRNELGRWFSLSEFEKQAADELYKKENRTLSYEFYPVSGIGWGIRVKDLNTGEIFDITDTTNW